MKLTIDAITAGITAPDNAALFMRAINYILLLGAATALTQMLTSFQSLISESLSLQVLDHLSDELHRQSVQVDLNYYENSHYFDTLHRAQQGAIYKPTSAFNNSMQLLQNAVSMIGMLVILFSFHWLVTVLLIAAVIPGLLFRLKFSRRLFQWDRSQTATQRHSSYYHYLLTADAFAKEIRLFNLGALFIRRFHHLRGELRAEKIGLARRRTLAEVMTQLFTVLTIYGSFSLMAYRSIYGMITIGDLIMYYQAFQRGLSFFSSLLSNGASLYEDSLYLSNLFEFLQLKPSIVNPPHPQPIFKRIEKGISFQDLSFSYPDSDKSILQKISFTVSPGEHIAIVGQNGAGKSTLIKLLCRLYDPLSGRICIDGVDLRQMDVQDLRRQISVVFQDFVRYHMTVSDNIWFGDVSREKRADDIQASAIAAGLSEVLRKLPQGLDTKLGKMFDEGHELSLGEWQKVALARAFMRPAQIIILDEPTSSLDARSEYEIFKKFQELAAGKTAFLISHRLSTARLADRIIVLDEGRLVEQGAHDELIRLDGIYAHLFHLQSRNYR
jgi:ATP-binding cassette subfamily B protein